MHPILFSTPWFNVYSYGLFVALGYTLAMVIAIRAAGKKGLNKEAFFDMMILQMIVGILGCRLLFILEYTPSMLNLSDFFAFEQGGMTFYGSVITGFIFDLLYLKLRQMPFWKSMDCIGLCFGPGIAVARIGCFLNGCCFGTPCSQAIGFQFRHAGNGYYHATQLYESILCLVAFAIVYWFMKKRQTHHGQLFLGFISLYGFFRFFIEFLRAENPIFVMGITLSQTLSLVFITASIIIWQIIRRHNDLELLPDTSMQRLDEKK